MRENIRQRNATGDVDLILELSSKRSKLTVESERMRKNRNLLNARLTKEAKTMDPNTRQALADEARQLRVSFFFFFFFEF